jgi:hypothetical protein
MSCITKSSIKEILHGLNIKDQTCVKKVLRFNRLLRMFYNDTYDFEQNIIAHHFNSTDWEIIISTEYPIYKVWWFYGSWTWACFEEMDIDCSACCSTDKRIKVWYSNNTLVSGKYIQTWEKEIKIILPCNATNAYLLYSRWPENVTSICDTIEIEWFMKTWLEFLIERFYERNEWNSNRQQLHQSDYNSWIERAKKTQSKLISYIWK